MNWNLKILFFVDQKKHSKDVYFQLENTLNQIFNQSKDVEVFFQVSKLFIQQMHNEFRFRTFKIIDIKATTLQEVLKYFLHSFSRFDEVFFFRSSLKSPDIFY